MEVSVEHCGNKLFVDFSQNDGADTLASAYSIRPKQPNVSSPIEWDELSLKLKPADFNLETMAARLLEKGDLWKDWQDAGIKTKNSKLLKQIM